MNPPLALRATNLARTLQAAGTSFTLSTPSFELARGDRVALLGPSGCGKSTLLALLSLAMTPTAADELALDGADALALWTARDGNALAALRARTLGFVPQTAALLPFLTLRANIALPQQIAGRLEPGRTEHLAERLGIAAVLDRKPTAVSVGQRQRAAIARALSHRPRLLLADEPTASVHPAQADDILALLTEAAGEDGAALLISTHDAARAAAAGFALAPAQPDGPEGTSFRWPAQTSETPQQ